MVARDQAPASAQPCQRPAQLDKEAWFPLPGAYRIEMTQVEEVAAPVSATGTLHLVCAAGHWSGSNLYGWMAFDFARLNVAVDGGGDVPSPASKDPERPGVVIDLRFLPAVLSIGAASNVRPREYVHPQRGPVRTESLDGGGMALRVEAVGPGRFSGSWSRAGIKKTGSGTFVAELSSGDPGPGGQ